MSLLRRLIPWLPFGWVRHMYRPDAATGALAPYLNRYTIRKQNESGANPWRVYLHEFLASDGAGHHSHPSTWGFSLVLWGSYEEEVLEEGCPPIGLTVCTRRVRLFNWIPATKYHRITQLHPGRVPWAPWRRCRGVWTVFVCGPLSGRGWGFYVTGQGHVDHQEMEHTKVREIAPTIDHKAL